MGRQDRYIAYINAYRNAVKEPPVKQPVVSDVNGKKVKEGQTDGR